MKRIDEQTIEVHEIALMKFMEDYEPVRIKSGVALGRFLAVDIEIVK